MVTPPAAYFSLAGRVPCWCFFPFPEPGILLCVELYVRRSLLRAALWEEAVLVILVSVRMIIVGSYCCMMEVRVSCARMLLAIPAVFQVRIRIGG